MDGVLFINLGTPQAPTVRAVRRYLREFLMDGRVIDIHPVARFFLVHFIIAVFRAPKSARAYQSIWSESGSPLMVHSLALTEAVSQKLGDRVKVAMAMRYGQPSIETALAQLRDCRQITVVPLYPQYASASTGSVLQRLYEVAARDLVVPHLSVVPAFYDHPGFVDAWVANIKHKLQPEDHLLLSFHGLPAHQQPCTPCDQRGPCVDSGAKQSCYRAQCYASALAIATSLNLRQSQWSVAFQSRLGRAEWIRPYTDELIDALPARGVKRVVVACPSFVADCLETLEEIGLRGRDAFFAAGGERFELVGCLNATAQWVDAVTTLVRSTSATSD